jgi:hypothetical protein
MDRITAFMELSALLTGHYQIVKDPVERELSLSTADEYLRRLSGEFPERLSKLLNAYQKLVSTVPPPELNDALLAKLRAEPEFAANELVAKQIVNIWYLSQFRAVDDDNAEFIDGGFYERGLVWDVIKAHPIGFSDRPHGYWVHEP